MKPADERIEAALADEERRLQRLRLLVDLSTAVIRTHPLSRGEAEQVVEHLRTKVLSMFPGKGGTFDLIYRPRLRRLIESRFGPA
jgi:hypothetical protein